MRRGIWIAAALATTAACGGTAEHSAAGAPASNPPAVTAGATAGVTAGVTGAALYSVRSDGEWTTVSSLAPASGGRSLRLDGRFSLPVVVDGGTEGLSHDGGTLVLQGPRSGASTRFAVLDGRLATPPRFLDLPGDFSYDAMSPDGSVLYLIEHMPPAGSDHYAVRALDVVTGKLRDGVIVDKRTPDESMTGSPLARAASPDGAVVATLYLRASGESFVHLLGTADGWALCADLPRNAGPGWKLRFTDGSVVVVSDPAGAGRFAIDPQSAAVAPVS